MTPGRPFRLWVAWVGTVHLIFGYFAFSRGTVLSTGGYYDFALGLLPWEAWGVLSLSIPLVIAWAHFHQSIIAAFVALGLALPTQFVFGLSIGIKTLTGTDTAILGTLQWWTMAIGNIAVLWAAAKGNLAMERE